MSIRFEYGSSARKVLRGGGRDDVKQLMNMILNDVTLMVERIIKQRGFAPRAKGHFAAKHQSQLEDQLVKKIINTLRVENGEYLWKYIVEGHHVLTTDKARKWWFWYLHNKLGGSYERKTSGPSGYVPGDNYHERALHMVVDGGYIQNIVRNRVREYIASGG